MQIVFQDPYASLNPRMTVRVDHQRADAHPQATRGRRGVARRGADALVGLNPEHANRFPHEFSGGQRQRIGIAPRSRWIPSCSCSTSRCRRSTCRSRPAIVNLLEDLQDELGLAYLFIAHDLSVVRHICDDVAVMYLGKIVEMGSSDDVYDTAEASVHAGAALGGARSRSAQASANARASCSKATCRARSPRRAVAGSARGAGRRKTKCATEEPALIDRGAGHPVACHFPEVRVDESIGVRHVA